MTTESPLRDLARKIYETAKEHPAYSQGHVAVQACVDHLNAVALNVEYRQARCDHKKFEFETKASGTHFKCTGCGYEWSTTLASKS